MSSCIITGASGFIGTHLMKFFLDENRFDHLYVLDRQPPKLTDSRITHFQVDIRHIPELDFPDPPQVIYHLTALAREPGYEWDEYFQTNLTGTVEICNLAERYDIPSIITTSTMMVYRAGEQRMTENSLTAPDTAYGISKLLAEAQLKIWQAAESKRRLRIIRASVVFGKGENGNFLNLYKVLRRGLFFYIGRDTTVKSCIYVKDLVHCMDFLTTDTEQQNVYNLSFPEPTTIGEICRTMLKVFNLNSRIITVPYSLALVGGYAFEILNNLRIFKSAVHHRRIQKLYYSTNISADALKAAGFSWQYSLEDALQEWREECLPDDLY